MQKLCATLLYRSYPRLTRPPANLQPDEMLGAVVERLIKARVAADESIRQQMTPGEREMLLCLLKKVAQCEF